MFRNTREMVMAVTDFGKILRKLRIDHNEILLNMAEKLGVTASYLSAVENGKRDVPRSWIHLLPKFYCLSEQATEELKQAAIQQIAALRISLDKIDQGDKELVIAFARRMDELDDLTREQLKKILFRKEKPE